MNRRSLLIGGGSLATVGIGAAYVGASGTCSASDYQESVQAMRATLAEQPATQGLIRYATLALDGHNTQPWRFAVSSNRITLRPDVSRRTPVVDPDDHHVFASLGCAAETFALAGAARRRAGDLRFDEVDGGAIAFDHSHTPGSRSVLFDAIPKRQSTRNIYDGRPVSSDDLATLATAAAMPGVDLVLITDRPRMGHPRDLVAAGNGRDPAFIRELKSWLRFNPRQALRTGDGLHSATVGSRSTRAIATRPGTSALVMPSTSISPSVSATPIPTHTTSAGSTAAIWSPRKSSDSEPRPHNHPPRQRKSL